MKPLILAHPKRHTQAINLWSNLGGQILWDYDSKGAAPAHYRALQYIQDHGQHIIIEDDAIPTTDFLTKTQAWINKYPGRVISFYLGTTKPVWAQKRILEELTTDPDMIELPNLLHGVCYTVTPAHATKILDRLLPSECTDVNMGYALQEQIIYPIPSLADHTDDGTNRKAHRFTK